MTGLFHHDALDAATVAILSSAGWHKDRHVGMTGKADEFARWGVPMHATARAILEQLSGLVIDPVGFEGVNFRVDRIRFDPEPAADKEVIQELHGQFAEDLFPIALMYVDGIYVAPSGLTVCSLQEENWIIGRSFEESLDRLVCLTGEVERYDRP